MMKKRDVLFDPACQECAEHFLAESFTSETATGQAARVQSLAQSIQIAVEEWFHDSELSPEQPLGTRDPATGSV